MARPLRIEYPGAWYPVTCRGNKKRNIFGDDRDRVKFLEILATNIGLHGVEVRAYVLMENHFHLLLMTPQANLKNFMQRFNTTGIGGIWCSGSRVIPAACWMPGCPFCIY